MVSVLSRPKARAIAPVIASAGALALLLTGCGAGGGSSASGSKDFGYLTNVENTTIRGELEALSKDQCKAENAAAPLKIETVPQTSLDQKLQLLAGQNALPAQYAAGNAPALTQDLDKSGNVLDFEKALKDLNISDAILPGAAATIKSLYGGKLQRSAVPVQHRGHLVQQEDLRRQRHRRSRQTWDDFVAAGDKLKAAGVTAACRIRQAGLAPHPPGRRLHLPRPRPRRPAEGRRRRARSSPTPSTSRRPRRLPTSAPRATSARASARSTTTPRVNSSSPARPAMFYMGSWVLANFNDPAQNKIGAENIGFMPFPAVERRQGQHRPVRRRTSACR